MDMNMARVKRCYEPYQRESEHCLFLALAAFAVVGLLLGAIGGFRIWSGLIWLLLGFLIVELLTNGYLGLLSLFELRKKAFVADLLFLEKVEIASAWSSHWGESIIPKLYPKRLRMQSCKIRCTAADGKSLVLRSAMSQQKLVKLERYIEAHHGDAQKVLFGKHSHIILEFQSDGYDAVDLNRMQ